VPTQNLAIMFTDIKGFTARVSGGKRKDLKQLLSTHERLLAPVITHFEGTIVKTIGDSFLARFDSPTDAVLCGVAIQEVLRQHNAFASEEDRIDVRVAINSGDVEVIAGDVMGEAVNLAARLEGIAEAGEVYFTEAVYLAMNRREAPSTEIGERTFAGIPYPVRVFKVVQDPNSELTRRVASGVRLTDQGPVLRGLHDLQRETRRRRWPWAAGAAAVVVLAAVWLHRAMTPGNGSASRRQEQASAPGTAETSGRPRTGGASGAASPGDRPENLAAGERNLGAGDDSGRGMPTTAGPGRASSDTPRPATRVPATKTGVVAEGRRRLEDLTKSQGAAAALDWLRGRLDQDPQLEPLRDEIPALDARATGERIVQTSLRGNQMADAVAEVLARYPKSAAAALELARVLEGNVVPAYYPVVLYDAAIKRGADVRNPHIPEFCFGLMPHHWPGWLDAVHDLLRRHYDSEAIAWARKTIEQDESGVSLANAWRILSERQDPRVSDPYYQALHRATDGYNSQADADRDLALFRQVADRDRRRQVLSVYRWVFKPEKEVSSFGYSRPDLARRNLETLETLWGKE